MSRKEKSRTPTEKKKRSYPLKDNWGEIKQLAFLKSKLREKQREKTTTAQKSIPYMNMYQDGICRVTEKYFSKTVQFYDINFQLLQDEDKSALFRKYCGFLNYFDHSVKVQFSFVNQQVNTDEYTRMIDIPAREDGFQVIRQEYTTMLRNQLAKGNNGLVKTKYITFGVDAENLKAAKSRLEHIEADILNNFKGFGVRAKPLNGVERLEILHHTMHQDTREPFRFHYGLLKETGLSTKDFIAPAGFDFRNDSYFKMGTTVGSVSILQIIAPELTDEILARFLDIEENILVNIHIQSVDHQVAIKQLKMTLSDIQKMKIEEQKKAVRSGYDMDVLPTDIETYGEGALEQLKELQSRNEKMFLVSFIIMNTAKTRQKLENLVFRVAGIAQTYNCNLCRMQFMQEQGLFSSLPLGLNLTESKRSLTTKSTAIFVPFTTQELFMEGEALYYGLNALSNNMIMVDRKRLKNPNGLIFGASGSGKSFAAKREMLNAFLITQDDIIICDPEAEYYLLVEALKGQVIKLSPNSPYHINPLDLNLNYSEEDDPLSLKCDFVLSLFELMAGGKEGLKPEEKSIIDLCLRKSYRRYMEDPIPENMPILEDLYQEIRAYGGNHAEHIADCMEMYVHGSQKMFNYRTNVDLNNRLVCYDIKELGKQLKKIGMLIVQDQVWNKVTINRELHKYTRYYVDEFHLLLKEEQTATFFVEIWKRFRKWGGIPTAITQNVKDMLASREIQNIFENSDFIYMLSQASGDRAILAKALNISRHQLRYVTQSNVGEGLIFCSNVIIPFVDRYPKDTMTYNIMTTKPEEVGGAMVGKQT